MGESANRKGSRQNCAGGSLGLGLEAPGHSDQGQLVWEAEWVWGWNDTVGVASVMEWRRGEGRGRGSSRGAPARVSLPWLWAPQ